MDPDLDKKWREVLKRLSDQFGGEPDLNAVIFLVGVQESGRGYAEFTKDQKIEIMHIAICKLLAPYGYYEYEGMDDEGWPHYRAVRAVPVMTALEQIKFMKKAIVAYFEMRDTGEN